MFRVLVPLTPSPPVLLLPAPPPPPPSPSSLIVTVLVVFDGPGFGDSGGFAVAGRLASGSGVEGSRIGVFNVVLAFLSSSSAVSSRSTE